MHGEEIIEAGSTNAQLIEQRLAQNLLGRRAQLVRVEWRYVPAVSIGFPIVTQMEELTSDRDDWFNQVRSISLACLKHGSSWH